MANTDANDLGLEHHYSHAHPGTFSLRLYKEEKKTGPLPSREYGYWRG